MYPFWRAYPNDPRFTNAKDAPAVVREWKNQGGNMAVGSDVGLIYCL